MCSVPVLYMYRTSRSIKNIWCRTARNCTCTCTCTRMIYDIYIFIIFYISAKVDDEGRFPCVRDWWYCVGETTWWFSFRYRSWYDEELRFWEEEEDGLVEEACRLPSNLLVDDAWFLVEEEVRSLVEDARRGSWLCRREDDDFLGDGDEAVRGVGFVLR